jgi:murein DD-endopeptidase MepM/ murein hydrolase activator NlpD
MLAVEAMLRDMRADYKPASSRRPDREGRQWVVTAASILAVAALSLLSGMNASAQRSAQVVEMVLELPQIDDESTPLEYAFDSASDDGERVIVRNGDSLARIFARVGFSAAEVHAVATASHDARRLTRLRPNETLTIRRGDDGTLSELDYPLDDARTLRVSRDDDRFFTTIIDHPIETRISYAEGVIESSLFLAARAAGLSDSLTMEVARIFGWDVDFYLDIRGGDRFVVLYEEIYRDGEKLRDGAILAAEFVNRGRSFRAVRFVDDFDNAEFFTPEGLAMRKAFLRAPVDFTRISSNFNPRRRHPILNTIRAHRGTDYAAPAGTPIKAAGDGRIAFRGRKGGYGNMIEVQHGGNITTLYAHLSGFVRTVGVGTRVKQGQTIGYVGRTGLATAPHLHYEFRLDGVHRNPVTVALPNAHPLPVRYRDRFETRARPLLAHLEAQSSGGQRIAALNQAASTAD